jgi:hypothetical protein
MDLKKFSITLTLILFSFASFGQEPEEMRYDGNNTVYLGDMPLTVGDAANMSISKSMEANMHFSKASRIRGWNIFRYVLGGWETFAGAYNLGLGNALGAVDLGLGVLITGSTFGRETKRKRYIVMGVKAYNKALEKEK